MGAIIFPTGRFDGRRVLSCAAACLIAVMASAAGLAAPEVRIGVTAAVVPMAVGQPPDGPESALRVGAGVVSRERVSTAARGRVQLLFLDGSALTLGHDSEIVLDEYVFDATGDSSRIAMSMGRGLLRYVGGRISKQRPALIRAFGATIGIRGGIALVEVSDTAKDGPLIRATLLFGDSLYVETAAGRSAVARPGYTIGLWGPAALPAAPVRADRARVVRLLSSLEQETGRPGAGQAGQAVDDGIEQLRQVPVPTEARDTGPSNGIIQTAARWPGPVRGARVGAGPPADSGDGKYAVLSSRSSVILAGDGGGKGKAVSAKPAARKQDKKKRSGESDPFSGHTAWGHWNHPALGTGQYRRAAVAAMAPGAPGAPGPGKGKDILRPSTSALATAAPAWLAQFTAPATAPATALAAPGRGLIGPR